VQGAIDCKRSWAVPHNTEGYIGKYIEEYNVEHKAEHTAEQVDIDLQLLHQQRRQ
jgi:hypothetical protein